MILSTKGVVLKSIKYGETSLILDVYTLDLGLRTYLINGVRSAKARTPASMLQVGSILDLVVYEKPGSGTMHRIKEARLDSVYVRIPFEILRGGIVLFMMEVVRKSIREGESNESLYRFLIHSLSKVDSTEEALTNFPAAFLLDFSTFLGFRPSGVANNFTPYFHLQEGQFTDIPSHHTLGETESLALYALGNLGIDECHTVHIPLDIRKNLLEGLLRFYYYHIEHMSTVNAHEVLETVFNVLRENS